MNNIHSINQIISQLSPRLGASPHFSSNACQVIMLLLQKVTGKTLAHLTAHPSLEITPDHYTQLILWIDQLVNEHKPLQYIVGSVEFCSVTLDLKPPIFIPRPETEQICDWLITQLQPVYNEKLTLIDMCTGTGAIALSLAKALKRSKVIGCDINEQSIALAQHNATRNNLTNATFIHSNLFEAVPRDLQFDMIVSNPPYVTEQEWDSMSPTITKWEDKRAFTAPHQGLKFYELISKQATKLLKKHSPLDQHSIPRLIFEIGETQSDSVTDILRANKFSDIKVYQDFGGKNRWITASF